MVLTLTWAFSKMALQTFCISQATMAILLVKHTSKAKSSANLSSITTPFGVIAISYYYEIGGLLSPNRNILQKNKKKTHFSRLK
jgi:hypothetical protein